MAVELLSQRERERERKVCCTSRGQRGGERLSQCLKSGFWKMDGWILGESNRIGIKEERVIYGSRKYLIRLLLDKMQQVLKFIIEILMPALDRWVGGGMGFAKVSCEAKLQDEYR